MLFRSGTSPTFANGTKSGFYVSLEIAGTELMNAAGKSSGGTDRVTNNQLYGNGGWSCTNSITEAPGTQCGVNRSDLIDQNYIWIDGQYGKIFMGGVGGTNGANAANALNVGIVRTYSGVNAVTGADPDADPAINVGGQSRMNSSAFNDRIQGSGQQNKIVYTTPTFSGARLGLVYTPDLVMENTTAPTEADDNGQNGTQTELYGQWAGKVGSVGTRLSLGYVMTTAEAGLPDYVASGIFSMLAPAGTPKEVIDKINAEMMAASKDPTVQSRFRDQGAEPTVTTPEELAKIVKEDNAKWIGIIQKAGMQPQ